MYKLILNEKQFTVVIKALDFYSRIGIGQLNEIVNICIFDFGIKILERKLVESFLKEIKRLIFKLSENASYGISSLNSPEYSKISYDILQVMRNKIAWVKNPEGGITVDFDKPFKTSKEKLPKVEFNE